MVIGTDAVYLFIYTVQMELKESTFLSKSADRKALILGLGETDHALL